MESVVIHTNHPIKLWVKDDFEHQALQQAINVANLPDVFRHVAIMPDAHMGMGVPIGCVFATQKTIVPNAVGVDIGCGMTAVKLPITEEIIRNNASAIINGIHQSGILSVRRQGNQSIDLQYHLNRPCTDFVNLHLFNAINQLGTLGGGNHFIEFQRDQNNDIWLMIHSGSRNLGQKIGVEYNMRAEDLNERYFSSVPISKKLAFLPLDSEEGKNYVKDMNFAVAYAKANRENIIMIILDILEKIHSDVSDVDFNVDSINSTHNFARLESHFGHNVMVHRKGATFAGQGEIGLIPGSQGTCSYIVEGLGNKESFDSCSHGAGRKYSRSKAKTVLDLEYEQLVMDDQNIIHNMTSVGNLDEAAGAYKDIDEVMSLQQDLVSITHKLSPILVVKN